MAVFPSASSEIEFTADQRLRGGGGGGGTQQALGKVITMQHGTNVEKNAQTIHRPAEHSSTTYITACNRPGKALALQ